MKIISPYGLLITLMLTLSACGGGGGSADKTPVNPSSVATTSSSSISAPSSSSSISSSSSVSSLALSSSSSSSKKANVVTITGLVTDNTIPNATVTIYVGSQTFTTTSDANGKYTINLTVDDANLNKPIKAVAKGGAAQSEVEFVSLLPSFKTLIEQAGNDAMLNSVENFAVNITNVTTAEYALIEQNKFSTATDAELETAKKNISDAEKLKLAALIKIVVDSPDYNLPNGVNTTLELVSNKTTSDAYAATLDASLIQSTIKTILNDKTLTPSSPLLGSWVMDDANLQYPNKTIAVISFINNTDFMFVRIGKQPDDSNCSSGVEFGSYEWNQATGAMNFKATEDGNGDCGVARIDKPQTFTVSIAGNELSLGNAVLKKVGGNYPLAGSWTLVDNEGRLNIHTYISSTTLIAYSPESWGYLSYNYNAATGDFTTHTIAASNEDFVEDFVGVVTKPNESQLSSYDSVKKTTEILTALSQLEYQFPAVISSNDLVGSWYFSDTSKAYPLQTHIVLSFSNNHEYMITMDFRADHADCSDGIERGTYSIDSVTGVISTHIEASSLATSCDDILDGATLKAESLMSLTWSEGGNILANYSRLIDWNTLIGTWTRPNGSGGSSTLSFLPGGHYLRVDGEELEFGNFSDSYQNGAHSLTITPVSNNNSVFTVNYTQANYHNLTFVFPDSTTQEWEDLPTLNSSANRIVADEGGNNSAALSSPNGGELWKNGEQQTITWNTQYITGATVDLYILQDNPVGLVGNSSQTVGATINSKYWYKFAGAVSNTGAYNLDPAIFHGNGNAYMVLVVSATDKTKFDISDATFSLKPF